MSKIKVKFDDLEEFADKIGKVERECDEALEALNWHFTSLLANFPGMLPDSIHALEYELRYSINEYKNKLDEAQRLIRLTAAEMEKDEQKMGNKVSEFLLELVGWNDAQRVFSEYDPVTGEKLSFGDRVLAGGFLALSLLPPVKAVGVGGKTVIKGVDAGIPALAKTPGVLKKIRNVLEPKKIMQAFRSVYDQVVNAPIALTKAWFDTIKKEIGEIRLPQIAQEAYAGIGATERTVKDAFNDAKDLLQGIKNTKLDELDVGEAGGATKGIDNATVTNKRSNLYRGDSLLHSPTRPNGTGKPHISSSGDLVPASKEGLYKGRQVTVTEHILGGYRKGAKSNSPYTSFTNNKNVIGNYGENAIELDISALRKDIQSGKVKDVVILSPKQIQKLIERDTVSSDFWKNRAINWTKRDNEYLIKGEVPSQYIKVLPKE
ncbi:MULTISPECIES: pre-toxin TG domain-containing protein [Bacillaceae]|uniref:pre-toxin TG domain-containing protein n=1 Tax=Bacillaceae TaxID=186817 RepID=UPI00203F2ADF|nr:pre-toxin TG domain-containing protein [Caldibacillus thermoamylovorans]MCM3054851.1 pre-toxin TG domain-containing protein [Caldibacillus thermoamylovorans]